MPQQCRLSHTHSCSRFLFVPLPIAPTPRPCSQNKWPDEAGLAALWEDNKDALLAFPLAAAYGGCALVGSSPACSSFSAVLLCVFCRDRACLHLPLSCSPPTSVSMCFPCRLWGTVREEGSLRGSKGKEVAPLGGANITGAAAAGAGLRR